MIDKLNWSLSREFLKDPSSYEIKAGVLFRVNILTDFIFNLPIWRNVDFKTAYDDEGSEELEVETYEIIVKERKTISPKPNLVRWRECTSSE